MPGRFLKIFFASLGILILNVGCKSHSNSDSGGGVPTPTPTASATHTLTIAKAGTGSGTVTSEDGFINCGTACSHAYADGSQVVLHQSKAVGSDFYGWTGGTAYDNSVLGTLIIYPLTANLSETATFKPTTLDLNHCTGVFSQPASAVANRGSAWEFDAGGPGFVCLQSVPPAPVVSFNCSFSGTNVTNPNGVFSSNCTVFTESGGTVFTKP